MITTFKTYENRKPKKGDYIIVNFNFSDDNMWKNYIDTTIGQLIEIRKSTAKEKITRPYRAKYDVSEEIYSDKFKMDRDKKEMINTDYNGKYYIIMNFPLDEIIYYSSNKEDLDAILAQNKFNL